ncbi:endonuclease domain-containing protein [Micromonospora andamanensis]|uniref:endonuclease domain-containing protein n=1 Tax=Micromonospora andamanensis TaxID=1287068 RepID=UPI001EF2EE1E|nr:endonuclease domain-containing protein [Micromonospora andamanensis]
MCREQALGCGYSRHEVDNLVAFGRWQSLARAVYLPQPLWVTEPSRRQLVRAALLSLGPAARVVHGSAAELHGIAGLPRSDEIHIGLPGVAAKRARAGQPHVVLHQLEHPATSLVSLGGMPATDAITTVSDVILRVGRYPAVSVLDSALNRGLLVADDLTSIAYRIRRRRGAVAARGYLAEADGRAQSPLETRTRLRCVDGRVPPDALQLEMRDDDGHLLGIGDLGWRAPKVIAEADGQGPHSLPEAIFADRRRQNRLTNAGWKILRFTWQDTLDPAYIPWVVRQALCTSPPR